MPSPTWNISFGDYDLSVDRRALTLTLTETKTGTVWGAGVSMGWIELREQATGDITRHDFGSLRQVSVSEKAGPQGKRILWGLDADGVPVDVYLICSQREIQMVVEASRDSQTHRVHGFGLVPGLCSVPEGSGNFRILAHNGDGCLRPFIAPEKRPERQSRYRVWGDLAMPLTGAMRQTGDGRTSAMGLFTDSAYAYLADTGERFDWEYERDPERRRLDLRILVFPDGDAISVARAYRDKQIATNNHFTLRRKMRDNPAIEQVLGHALLLPVGKHENPEAIAEQLNKEYGVPCAILKPLRADTSLPYAPLQDLPEENQTRWSDMESRLEKAKQFQQAGELTRTTSWDWSAAAADLWPVEMGLLPSHEILVPLNAAIYHDSVVLARGFYAGQHYLAVLRALLNLAVPHLQVGSTKPFPTSYFGPAFAVLCPLHKFTFSAFLTEHRFLTPDYLVEEAVYSDKTRVVINQSDTNTYEGDDLTLPPLGFYVRHRQMEAHDALRVGADTFQTRKYRIRRAMDGKPLDSSESVTRQEFDLPFFDARNQNGENPLS